MRTTVDIDDSVLVAVKALARDEGVSLGVKISELVRRGLKGSAAEGGAVGVRAKGFPVLAGSPGAAPVTLDVVNELRDAE